MASSPNTVPGANVAKSDIGAIGQMEISARRALGDDQQFVAGIVFAKHHAVPFIMFGVICDTTVLRSAGSNPANRPASAQWDFFDTHLLLRAQQVVFRPFDGAVDVGENVRTPE